MVKGIFLDNSGAIAGAIWLRDQPRAGCPGGTPQQINYPYNAGPGGPTPSPNGPYVVRPHNSTPQQSQAPRFPPTTSIPGPPMLQPPPPMGQLLPPPQINVPTTPSRGPPSRGPPPFIPPPPPGWSGSPSSHSNASLPQTPPRRTEARIRIHGSTPLNDSLRAIAQPPPAPFYGVSPAPGNNIYGSPMSITPVTPTRNRSSSGHMQSPYARPTPTTNPRLRTEMVSPSRSTPTRDHRRPPKAPEAAKPRKFVVSDMDVWSRYVVESTAGPGPALSQNSMPKSIVPQGFYEPRARQSVIFGHKKYRIGAEVSHPSEIELNHSRIELNIIWPGYTSKVGVVKRKVSVVDGRFTDAQLVKEVKDMMKELIAQVRFSSEVIHREHKGWSLDEGNNLRPSDLVVCGFDVYDSGKFLQPFLMRSSA